jgi:hypothetical protein
MGLEVMKCCGAFTHVYGDSVRIHHEGCTTVSGQYVKRTDEPLTQEEFTALLEYRGRREVHPISGRVSRIINSCYERFKK